MPKEKNMRKCYIISKDLPTRPLPPSFRGIAYYTSLVSDFRAMRFPWRPQGFFVAHGEYSSNLLGTYYYFEDNFFCEIDLPNFYA
jgi:hypothetical protein